MEKIRGFEIAKGFEDKGINIPVRKTKYSAGYDIEAAEDIVRPSFKKGTNPTLIKTGLKAYMQDDEVLSIHVRSSIGVKKGLMLKNVTGIIDSSYYANPNNYGNIGICLYNNSNEPQTIECHDRVAQGIFQKYLIVDEDNALHEVRFGGFGSSGK